MVAKNDPPNFLAVSDPFRKIFLSSKSLSDTSPIIALPWHSLRHYWHCRILFKLLNLSNLLHGFVNVVKYICQNFTMYFLLTSIKSYRQECKIKMTVEMLSMSTVRLFADQVNVIHC